MNIREIERSLRAHPVMQSEVAAEMQLGFPFLYQANGRLLLRYLPHRESVENGLLICRAPAYRLELCWPFRHFASFANLAMLGETNAAAAVALEPERMREVSRRHVQRLYESCDAALAERTEAGCVRAETLQAHHRAFWDCVHELGLGGIYGG